MLQFGWQNGGFLLTEETCLDGDTVNKTLILDHCSRRCDLETCRDGAGENKAGAEDHLFT